MNWVIFVIGLVFAYEQNEYFGWHAWPQSDNELITDGIVLLIFAMSLLQLK